MKIYLDIETIPTQRKEIIDEIRSSITAPGNYTKQESITKWLEENLEAEFQKKYRQTALDGAYGEIISISWALEDQDPNVVYRDSIEPEKHILQAFFKEISNLTDNYGQRAFITQWIGHYITGFDLRFIWQRCVVNKVIPTVPIPYDAKPWDDKVYDTKIEWSGSGQYSGKSSLNVLCNVMGYEGKCDIDGSKVYDYWLDKKYREIAEYNKDDVIKTRQIYKRMNFIN